MSTPRDFSEVVDEIIAADPRYAKNAYYFVRRALDFAVQSLTSKSRKNVGHISGAQLLEGFRVYALEQFGPMAATVFESWGLRETMDIGNIVFNLVEYDVLGKTDKDSPEEFKDVFDFSEAFEKPFLSKKRRRITPKLED
jgi:uncharacterized repeat protein (TIGR04138 family)